MEINFEKSDELLNNINEAVGELRSAMIIYSTASNFRKSEDARLKTLYDELVKITTDNSLTEGEKKDKRITAYSNAYNCEREEARSRVENIVNYSKYCEDFLNIRYTKLRNGPTKDDIENEFWTNCTDTSSVGEYREIYLVHWRIKLPNIGTIGCDDEHLKKHTSELLRCGLIHTGEAIKIKQIVIGYRNWIATTISEIRTLFNALDSSATVAKEDEAEADSQTKRTMRVIAEVLSALLKKTGIELENHSKVSELIGYIAGYSKNSIRTCLFTKHDTLSSAHRVEVEKVNKILSDLNCDISIKYDKNR